MSFAARASVFDNLDGFCHGKSYGYRLGAAQSRLDFLFDQCDDFCMTVFHCLKYLRIELMTLCRLSSEESVSRGNPKQTVL